MKILNQFSNYQSYQKALENETERLKEILKNKKEEQERLAMELLLKRQAEEQARLEKEKLERQKLEAEEAERKRLEAERLEKERIEREKNAVSEAKQKALQNIIDWAKTNNIPETVLPRETTELSKIKELNLSNLKLRDLPNDFHQMEQLTHLNLSGNFILKYSNNLENLKNLYLLDLSNCGLDEVPEFVFKIEKLGHLDVSKNNLSYFFVDENEFNHLEHLDISSNKFEEDKEIIENIYYNFFIFGEIGFDYILDYIKKFKEYTKIKRMLQSNKFKKISQKYQEFLEGNKDDVIYEYLIKDAHSFFNNFSFYGIKINSKLTNLKHLNLSNNYEFTNSFQDYYSENDDYETYNGDFNKESRFFKLRERAFDTNILKLKSLEFLDIQNTRIQVKNIKEIEKKFPFLRILKVSFKKNLNLNNAKLLRNLEEIYVNNKKYGSIDKFHLVNKTKSIIKNLIIWGIVILIGFWLFHSIAMNDLSNQPLLPPEPKGFFRKLFEGILIFFGIVIALFIFLVSGKR